MKYNPYFMSRDSWQKLIGIFALAIFLFNFPFIELFSGKGMVISIPSLFAYIFFSWGFIILLTFLVTKENRNLNSEKKTKNKEGQL